MLHVLMIPFPYLCKKNYKMKDKITFNEFIELQKKLEIKSGEVKEVEEVAKSAKLLKLTVDFGNEDVRTVVTNIKPLLGESFKEKLEGKNILFITNLEPVKMMGIESTAMILPGELEKDILLTVSESGVNVF